MSRARDALQLDVTPQENTARPGLTLRTSHESSENPKSAPLRKNLSPALTR